MPATSGSVPAAPTAESPPERFYQIVSIDGIEFQVSEKTVQLSETLKFLISATENGSDDVEKNSAIPIPNVTGEIVGLVVAWCKEYEGTQLPVYDDRNLNKVVIPEFDKNLMDIDNTKLFGLVCAANYLNIRGLLDVSCKKVSNMIKGKSPEEIRATYEIPTDEEDAAKDGIIKANRKL